MNKLSHTQKLELVKQANLLRGLLNKLVTEKGPLGSRQLNRFGTLLEGTAEDIAIAPREIKRLLFTKKGPLGVPQTNDFGRMVDALGGGYLLNRIGKMGEPGLKFYRILRKP
jgi:hypothetical protein